MKYKTVWVMYCTEEMTEGGPDGKDQVCKGWYKKKINNLDFFINGE